MAKDNLQMYAAIKRVRELHKPYQGKILLCSVCRLNGTTPTPYPCPTIKALEGEK